jgi:hypothetical protein
MTHAPHEWLPGYSPAQLLHDGCPECETRGQAAAAAIAGLDTASFERAWERAAAWQRDGGGHPIAAAEIPMLRALWAVQVQLERRGWPTGRCPSLNVLWGSL